MDLSVVVPVFEEEESLPRLFSEVRAAIEPHGLSYELIVVDDGSRDKSFEVMRAEAERDPHVVAIQLRRNFGQTAALQAGLDHASGASVVLMDADLQNDPRDIPMMLQCLASGHDLVAGWRADRQDPFFSRRLPSQIANWIIGRTTGVRLHDYGCTLKAMKGELAKELKLYGEMHRFIPALADLVGASIHEVKVNHRAREFGVSKYGIGRTLRVVLDLATVRFMRQFMVRPMQVFGFLGLGCFGAGFAICVVLAVLRLVYGTPLAERPLLLLGVLLTMVGVQLISLGLVADLVARTYFESQKRPPYFLREVVRNGTAALMPVRRSPLRKLQRKMSGLFDGLVSLLKRVPIDVGQGNLRTTTKGKLIALDLVPEGHGGRALDVGAREGDQTRWLERRGYQVTSVDVDPQFSDCLKVDANERLPFEDESFDLIWCSEVIEHLHKPEFAMSELRRVARPGAHLVLTTPNSYALLFRAMALFGFTPQRIQRKDHIQFFDLRDIQRLAPDAELYGYFPYFLIRRTIRRAIGALSPTFVLHIQKAKSS